MKPTLAFSMFLAFSCAAGAIGNLHAADIDALDLDSAAELASDLDRIRQAQSDITQALQLLKLPVDQIIQQVNQTAAARKPLRAFIESFAAPILERAQKSERVARFFKFGNDLKAKSQLIQQLQAKLQQDQKQASATKEEATAAIELVQQYTALVSSADPLNFAKVKLSAALRNPIAFDLGGKPCTIQIVGGTDQIFSQQADIAVRVNYAGGLTAKVTGIKVDIARQTFDFSAAKPVFDESTLQGAASAALGSLLKDVDLPLPLTIRNAQATMDGGSPVLTVEAAVRIPGLEFLTEMLSTVGGKEIIAVVVIAPSDIQNADSVLKSIRVTGVGGTINSPLFPLGPTFSGQITTFVLDPNTKRITVTGKVIPQSVQSSPLSFTINTSLETKGRPEVTIDGQIDIQGKPLGDFSSKISQAGISGTVTFPSEKSPSKELLSRVYSGNFNFTLDKSGFSADGVARLVEVVQLHTNTFLSFDPNVDSFLTAKETISLDGISGNVELQGRIHGFKTLDLAASVWVDVDLGLYKPTARIDIATHCDDLAVVPVVGAAAFSYDVAASALGIKVSFKIASLAELKLSDIEEKLRRQLGDMFQRLSSAAADWEKDKRELLGRWERHWADTISDTAKKYGVDSIKTGDPRVDGVLGDIASGGKATGRILSDFGKGVGGEAANARDQIETFISTGGGLWGYRGTQDREILLASLNAAAFMVAPTNPELEVFKKWQEFGRSGDMGKLSLMAKEITDRVANNDQRMKAAASVKALFGGGYGDKLSKAVLGQAFDPPDATETRLAAVTMRELPLFIASLDDYKPIDPEKDFQAFAEAVNRFAILKTRREGGVQRQLHIGFGDAYVDVGELKVVTVLFIARLAASEITLIADNSQKTTVAASNLVPVQVVFRPIKFSGTGYDAEIQLPDIGTLTKQQNDWIKDNAKKLQTNGGAGTKTEFDFSLSPDELSQHPEKATELLQRALGRAKDAKAAFNAQTVVRHVIQSLIESTLPGIELKGTKAQYERLLAFRNMTGSEAVVKVKIHHRQVSNGGFQWIWIPSPPGDDRFLEYKVDANSDGTVPLLFDGENAPDDFGLNATPVSASRIRMRAANLSGEVWDFVDTDVFLVDPADEFADDRVYDSPQQTVFSFVIQSRRAPPVIRATISNRELTIIEHQGDAQAEFTLPIGTNSIEDVVRTLAIDPAVGSPGLNADWDWDATYDASPLPAHSGALSDNTNDRSIRIRLNPQTPPGPNKPGESAPTFPVVLRYAQKSRPWESTYQLYLQTNASGQHFAHALRGFYLFENNSGVNWNRANVSLIDAGTSSEVSQLKIDLPHSKARLALQSSRPLDSTVEPFLIFDPTVNSRHPKRNLRITNSGKTTLTAGRITVIEDGKSLANFEVSSIKPADREVIAFPGDLDSRVCLTRLGPSTNCTYEARCLRGRCMEIVPLRRTQTIRANFNSDYASKEPVPLSIRLPKEECWQRVEQIVAIGATSPEQIIEVQQMRGEGWKYESLDLCSAPLDVLKSKQLDADDPYQSLLQMAITLRESGQIQKLQQLLQLPDLIVERAHAECCLLKGGMVVRLRVTVANLGGAPAMFRAGDVLLAVEGADPVRATQNTSFSCCERRVFQLTLRNRAIPPEVKVRLQVDPDNKVNEWNEADNVDVKSLAVKP